jgi:outer membrane receptor protein involved in Fe transport
MTTSIPESRQFHLGLGILNTAVGGYGTFGEDRGRWQGTLRRGNLDLALSAFLGAREKPTYWDGFGKLEYNIRPEHLLSVHVLHSDDNLDFLSSIDVDPDNLENYRTSYNSSYFWLGHQAVLGSRLFVDSVVSIGRLERDRQGREEDLIDTDLGFIVRDERRFDVIGLKEDWNLDWNDQNYLTWGFDVRHLESRYDYLNTRELEDFLGDFRSEPRTGTTRFLADLGGDQFSVYLSDRYRPVDPLTLELGLRYDRQTLTDDNDLSPRLNLVYAPGKASTWRLAWGLFHQSQRPYELQVEDGVTELVQSERTEQRVLGFEHTFSMGAKRRPLSLRVEVYQRLIKDPLIRFENLFEPRTEFPEIEPDRFRTAAERSRAYGLEVLLRGGVGQRFDWWANYAYARTQDRIEGRSVPRRIDQPHTLNLGFNYRLGENWNLNFAWRYHTGWPTTAIFGRFGEPAEDSGEEESEEAEDGVGGGFEGPEELEVVPVFGPLNAERLSSYHRLDLRASGVWKKKKGVLGFFIEIQNVYDRQNISGFDVELEFEVLADGEIKLNPVEEIWGGILPSFGFTWEF